MFVLIAILVVIVSIIIACVIVYFLDKPRLVKFFKKTKALIIAGISLTLIIGSGFIYLSTYTHAKKEAKDYVVNRDGIKVSKIKGGYFFDSPGSNDAIIFYPGARIDSVAYAPLLNLFGKENIDSYLVEFPFHYAFFKKNAAEYFIKNYKYDNYYIVGHSLGGAIAGEYVAKNNNDNKIKGVTFLAAYTTKKITNTKLLSIYGTRDGVLDIKKYNKNKVNFPDDSKEIVLEGANHTNFGYYSLQSGDKKSTITFATQQTKTVEEFKDFFGLTSPNSINDERKDINSF